MNLKKDSFYDVAILDHGIVDILAKVSEEQLEKTGLRKGEMTYVNAEDSKKIMDSLKNNRPKIKLGGSGLNTSRILAILGLKTYFSTTIGSDEYGSFLLKEIKASGINEGITRLADFPTATCISLITPDSERTMATNLGAAEKFSEKHIGCFKKILDTRIVYTTGYKLTSHNNKEAVLKAVKKARKKGVVVGFDLADANVLNSFKKEYSELLAYCDIVFMNHKEALAFGKSIEGAISLFAKKQKIIIIKTGNKGCTVHDSEKKETIKVNGFSVNANDTTGAGDSFAAGFLFGILKGFTLKNCAILGNFTASMVVQNIGAIITKDQINEIRKKIKELSQSNNS